MTAPTHQVTFKKSDVTATFDPQKHETLLDVALEAGVAVPYACCAGADGVCQLRCDGATEYLQDPLVTVTPGEVLLCIAKPTADVVIDG